MEGAVNLFTGKPGRECGVHAEASSYFDRLWNRVRVEDRFFLVLIKTDTANNVLSLGMGVGAGAGGRGAGALKKSFDPSLSSTSSSSYTAPDPNRLGRGGGFVPKLQLKMKREGAILQATGKKMKFD